MGRSIRKRAAVVFVAAVTAALTAWITAEVPGWAQSPHARARPAAYSALSSVQGTGRLLTAAVAANNGETKQIFVVPGILTLSVTCQSSINGFLVGFDNQQGTGWAETAGIVGGATPTTQGGQGLGSGGAGSAGFTAPAALTISLRVGFGSTAHVATVFLNVVELNSHKCQFAAQALSR